MSLQLLCVNFGKSIVDAEKAFKHCNKMKIFDEAFILHNDNGMKSRNHTEAMIKDVPKSIVCDHVLSIHWDGFIINPKLWDDSWFQYDFIGSPWRLENVPNKDWRVGSGGFCLFSKKMAEAWPYVCNLTENHDWQVGALYRDKFEALGMKYAPLEVASKFSKECDLEDINIPEGSTFGFHGFQYGDGYREKYRNMVYG